MRTFKLNTIMPLLLLLPLLMFCQRNVNQVQQHWDTDLSKKTVDLDEFTILLPRDGIPPIDQPKYWTVDAAQEVFFEHEPVIAIDFDGKAAAYPLSILMFHEIVNDKIGNQYVSVTYCPLCNAAIVFDRKLQHKGKDYLLDFGVSGMLRKSDLVMWDRQSETWWQQFTGEGLVGELAGAQLNMLPSMVISFEEFANAFPKGKVLSTETGHARTYGINPYTEYDDLDNQPRFFDGKIDSRLPAMERVIDIEKDGKYKIYPLSDIQEEKVINDDFRGKKVVLFFLPHTVSVLDQTQIERSKQVGSVTVFNRQGKSKILTFRKNRNDTFSDNETNSTWNIAGKAIAGSLKGTQLEAVRHANHLAFAWFAFHEDAEIWGE